MGRLPIRNSISRVLLRGDVRDDAADGLPQLRLLQDEELPLHIGLERDLEEGRKGRKPKGLLKTE